MFGSMYAATTLRGLAPDQLLELASAHEAQAAALRAAAVVRAQEIARREASARTLDEIAALPALGAQFERQGMTRADALTAAALCAGVNAATIASQMVRADRQARANQRKARDGRVLDLARAGRSNAEISRCFGIHRDTVSRITQTQTKHSACQAEEIFKHGKEVKRKRTTC